MSSPKCERAGCDNRLPEKRNKNKRFCHRSCATKAYLTPEVRKRYYYERRGKVEAYKMERGCTDCGYNKSPYALEFDHLPEYEKSFTISMNINAVSMDRIWEEIAKCEVVCANCHAIRSAERRNRNEADGVVLVAETGVA